MAFIFTDNFYQCSKKFCDLCIDENFLLSDYLYAIELKHNIDGFILCI
jgi:hypothetical protein